LTELRNATIIIQKATFQQPITDNNPRIDGGPRAC